MAISGHDTTHVRARGRTADARRPARLSAEVEAQLRKLHEVNDRHGLVLFWQAIRETMAAGPD